MHDDQMDITESENIKISKKILINLSSHIGRCIASNDLHAIDFTLSAINSMIEHADELLSNSYWGQPVDHVSDGEGDGT
jgi:hypothetical protein